MADEILYKPKDLFDTKLQKQYHDAAIEIFDQYADQAHVDVGANKIHVREYNEAEERVKQFAKKASSSRGKKILSFVFMLSPLLSIGNCLSENKIPKIGRRVNKHHARNVGFPASA